MNRFEPRAQTLGEEMANGLSHGLGFLLAVASLPILVVCGAEHGGAATVAGACAFSVTAMLLYFASAMYHALPPGRAKRVFNTLDHSAIYLFIAGSYTPFALGALRDGWGWAVFALVWGLAATGVALKSLDRLRHPGWSTGLYVAMGWLVLIAAAPLLRDVAAQALLWLLVGGLVYTAGAVVFMFDARLRYGHFVWHLCVLGGSVCHFLAALRYGS
jgi:hemolysin III